MEPKSKKKMGRPATGQVRHCCGFSLSPEEFAALDALCARVGPRSRSRVIGQLIIEAHARRAATTAQPAE